MYTYLASKVKLFVMLTNINIRQSYNHFRFIVGLFNICEEIYVQSAKILLLQSKCEIIFVTL